ncbi:MAG: radical SAM protein [Clostridiales Family XIII bacterium]|jgi:MoaA/NifB/PqqE/SkfB family radical SAM enzyme|nr:radical SAM protein [Clostridiales Family XIII bacterium]
MSKKSNIIMKYLSGKLRCAEFAVTNACIARCTFCNIWKQQPKIFVDKDKALVAIDRMADFGVSHMCLTGGEPLLHPHIVEFVEKASKRDINNAMLIAAPQLLLRDEMTKRLAAAGCDLVSISFDSADPETLSRSRQIENLMGIMENALTAVRHDGLQSMASVLIWNGNADKMEAVCAKAVELGFDYISLNYPTFSESDVYELGGEGIDMSKESLIQALEVATALKETRKYPIINLAGSMRNIIDYLKEPTSAKFPCRGGVRVMFLDWFFNMHPCMQLPDVLGCIHDMEESDLFLPVCNKCNMSWYRDLSAFFHGARSLPLIYEAFRTAGKFL